MIRTRVCCLDDERAGRLKRPDLCVIFGKIYSR